MKNKKFKAILSITGYFLLVLAICFSGALVFHSVYYELIYVSGTSMYPTLNGSEDEKTGTVVDFGIVDSHKSALNHIKRFSIVSTYYSEDYSLTGVLIPNSKQKIKRVIALPNETFKIVDSKLYVLNNDEFEYIPYSFNINPSVEEGFIGKDIDETTLGEDEYWVLGDNRKNSRDSGMLNEPVKKEYLIGVLVAIEGKAELKVKKMVCQVCGSSYKEGTLICQKCYSALTPEYELVNKQYHWPKYY